MKYNRMKQVGFTKYLFGMSIRKRLILYFISSILIPTIVLAITIYHRSSNIIAGKIDQLIEKNLNTAEVSILQKFETADDIATLISFNENLGDILEKSKPEGSLNIIAEMNSLHGILEEYHLSNLSNFTKTTLFPQIYMINRPEYKKYKVSDKVFDISEIENEQWYTGFSKGIITVVGLDTTKTMLDTIHSIKIARKLYGVKNTGVEYSALLTIDIEINYFNDILESIKSSPNSKVFILDQNHSVILKTQNYQQSESIIETSLQRLSMEDKAYHSWIEKIDGSKMFISIKRVDKLGWRIVSVAPMEELNEESRSFNKLVFIIIAVCTIISFMMALILSNDISKPITKLVRSMSSVKDGNFDTNITYKRKDEFAFLVEQYKTMMREIKELIDKLYISELNQKKMELKAKQYELKALQAQINPHFLYNTLDSVNWLALQYKAEDISIMVRSLSNFFRYSLSKGKSEITLEEEKQQVESYLTIQRIRYKEKLDFRIDFSKEIAKCKTVKLILQPLVENAIIHGLEKRKTGGFIEILGYRIGESVEIKISDNGVGANVEELNNILKNTAETDSFFGTKNVNERIKQFFGDEYGLFFCENEAGGVTVTMKLPFQKS